MHYFYTPISINGAPFLSKLTVEEYGLEGSRRTYNLQRITMSSLSRAQWSTMIDDNREKYVYSNDALTIAQLYELVKTYDKDFTPGKPINPAFSNGLFGKRRLQ